MNKQSKKDKLWVIYHAALKNNQAYLLCTEITKRHLNSRIYQHCGVKTSTVTPSFNNAFNISLFCAGEQHTKFHRKSMAGSFSREFP